MRVATASLAWPTELERIVRMPARHERGRRQRLGSAALVASSAGAASGAYSASTGSNPVQQSISAAGAAAGAANVALIAAGSGGVTGAAAAGTAAGAALGTSTAAALGVVAAAAPYVAAVAAVAVLAFMLIDDGPSKNWLSFGNRLQQTLAGINEALRVLAERIVTATTDQELAGAIAAYKQQVEQGPTPTPGTGPGPCCGVGGFAAQHPDPWDIPVPPGATGTEHEGGLVADFAPVTFKIRELLQAKRAELAVKAAAAPNIFGPAAASPSVMAAGLGNVGAFARAHPWLFLSALALTAWTITEFV